MKWIGTLLLMVAGAFGGKLIYQKVFAPQSDVPPGVAVGSREHLTGVAAKINATLPKDIDPDTRLVKVRAREKEIIYEYELVRYSSQQIDFQAFVRVVGDAVRRQACASPGMKGFWKHDIVATYSYTANDQFGLGSISVSKADCGS